FYFESSKTEVTINNEFVRIVRKGIGNKFALGSSGEKAILISSITSIQLKKPNLSFGYIQFNMAGNINNQGVIGAVQDENSILFSPDEMDIALMVQSNVEKLLVEKQTTPAQLSVTEEIRKYKELLTEGIITEVEFEKKKKSLLES
ncbi:SHOCT domain-containing protein, partial [Listeria monocytogenes]|nr:SHOCT domain-containing protein [Listeria monocytogenes]